LLELLGSSGVDQHCLVDIFVAGFSAKHEHFFSWQAPHFFALRNIAKLALRANLSIGFSLFSITFVLLIVDSEFSLKCRPSGGG
jgi:hypothetical protein